MERRRRWRILSRTILLAVLLASLPPDVLSPAAARQDQPGVTANSYESPTYGFTLNWGDSWQATRASSANGIDSLTLANDTGTIAFVAYPFTGDTASCIQARVGQLQIDPDTAGLTPVLDQAGEPLMGTDEVGSYAIYQYRQPDAGSADADTTIYLDCRTIPGSDAALLIEHVVPLAAYNEQIAARTELLASLQFASGQDAASATPGRDMGASPGAAASDAAASPEAVASEGIGPTLRWSTPASTSSSSSQSIATYVAFDAGIMYASESFGTVTALDWESGTRLWETSLSSEIWSIHEIAAANGVVAAVLPTGIVALDGATGEERWRAPIAADAELGVSISPPTIMDGMVFVHDYQNETSTVYGFDLATGEERWRVDTGPLELYRLPAANGLVYAVNTSGTLWALDGATGEARWTFALDWGSGVAPAVSGETVLASDSTGTLYAVDAATGDERWRAATDRAFAEISTGEGLVVSIRDNDYVAWELESGDERWRAPTTGTSSIMIAGDNVYVREPGLRALDIATGNERWMLNREGWSIPAITDDILYLASDGLLLAVDTTTGEERWQASAGDLYAESPLVLESAVVFTGGGMLHVVDPGSPPESGTGTLAMALPDREQLLIGTRAMMESVPPGDATLGLWRLTIAPGADATLPQFAGPVSLFVESGAFASQGQLNLVEYEGSSTTPDEDNVMQAGDALVLAPYERISGRNTGSADTVLLAAGILPGTEPVLPGDQPGVRVEQLGVGTTSTAPPTGMTVELARVSLPPATSLPLDLALWPRVIAVESGAIEVHVIRGVAEVQGSAAGSLGPGDTATLGANESLFVPPGTLLTISNANQGPLMLLSMEGWGNIRFLGGMAGCGGRCLEVTTP